MSPLRERGEALRARLLRGLRGLGWAGIVGAGLLAFGGAFTYSAVADHDRRLAGLAAEAARLRQVVAIPAADRLSERERLDAFYGRFPTATDLPVRLKELHRLADVHGVALARAEYRANREASSGLQRVTLSLPVSGAFAPVYAWLGEVLATMPEVAVESLAIKREKTTDGVVQMDLRLAVFVRSSS